MLGNPALRFSIFVWAQRARRTSATITAVLAQRDRLVHVVALSHLPGVGRASRCGLLLQRESTHSTELRSLRFLPASFRSLAFVLVAGRIVFSKSRPAAVSSVGAGCLRRRRPTPDCRLCQRGFQDGEFRFASAAFPLRSFLLRKGFARTMDVPHRGVAVAVRFTWGKPRRANADQREAAFLA